MDAVARARARHGRNAAAIGGVGLVIRARSARPFAFRAIHFTGVVERHGFGELRDHLIVQQHHRRPASLGQIEGADGLAVDFLHRGRRQHNDRIVAMAAPARLHQVGLRRPGRHAGGRAAAHDIDDDARDLGAGGVAEIFLLERKSRTAGRGHGFDAAHRSADHRRHRGDFVFHLHEHAIDFGQTGAPAVRRFPTTA